MAHKVFDIENIGSVIIYKKRSSKRINLRIVENKIKVSMPIWLPYAVSVKFVKENKNWINERVNRTKPFLNENNSIGKYHSINYLSGKSLRSKTSNGKINIYIPPHLHQEHPKVQKIAINAAKRALKKEADDHLPYMVSCIAKKFDYSYLLVKTKCMKSRWGSCTNQKIITLNIYLMMLPQNLIDYVILHELSHTKHLNHSKQFWSEVEKFMPNYKVRKQMLKEYQCKVIF